MLSLFVFAMAITQIAASDAMPSNYTGGARDMEYTGPAQCYGGFIDKTGGRAKYWACGRNCEGGVHWTDVHCNCACVRPTTANPTPAPVAEPAEIVDPYYEPEIVEPEIVEPEIVEPEIVEPEIVEPVEEEAEHIDIFSFYDDNDDGTVNVHDLREKKTYMKIWGEHNAGQEVPLTHEMVEKSKNEYYELWEEIKHAAKALDVSGNGVINSHDLNIMLDERKHAQEMLEAYQEQLKIAEQNLGKALDISFEDLDHEVSRFVEKFNNRMDSSFQKLGGDIHTDVPHAVFTEYLKDVTFLLCFLEKVEEMPTGNPHLSAAEYQKCLDSTHFDVATSGDVEMEEFAKLTGPGDYRTEFEQAADRHDIDHDL